MLENVLDEYFNYIQLSKGIKKEIWKPSFKRFNRKFKFLKNPFKYMFLGFFLYVVCFLGTFAYIKENIVIGRKQCVKQNKKPQISFWKEVFAPLSAPKFNWADAFLYIVLFTLIVDNVMLEYGPNQYNVNGIQHTRTHIQAQCPVKVEQKEIPAVFQLSNNKTRYLV